MKKLLSLLTLALLSIGTAWADEYELLDHSNKALAGNFIAKASWTDDDTEHFVGKGFAGYYKLGSNLSAWSQKAAESGYTIDYDFKTTSTTFTFYVGNTSSNTPAIYYVVYDESTDAHSAPDVAQTQIGEVIPKGNSTAQYTTRSVTITRSKNARVCFYTDKANNLFIYQIVAEETGTALPIVGEAGYTLNMNKGRFAVNGAKYAKIDGNIELVGKDSYTMANGSQVVLDRSVVGTQYIKFTTPASPGAFKLTYTSGDVKYNTTNSAEGAIAVTSGTAYPLAVSTTYYLINASTSNGSKCTKLEFVSQYSVTYDLNGGSGTTPTETDKADGNIFTLHDGTTGITAPDGKEFYRWKDQDDNEYAGGADFTMPAKNVTLTAQWRTPVVNYTVTYDLNGGEGVAPTEAAKEEDEVFALAAAPTRTCYTFNGWKCDIDDATYAAGADYTMTAAATTFTAQWTANYASGSYTFENNATVGTAPGKTVTTDATDYAAFQIDKLFFGAMKIQYESGVYGGEGDDFKGWKIKTNGATIKFLVETDKLVTVGVGNLSSSASISYTALNGAATNSALTAKTDNTYAVKGGTIVTVTTGGSSTVTLKKIAISDFASVTIGTTGWSTFSSAYGLDFSSATPAGLSAYAVTGFSGSALTKSAALTEAPAETGLLLNGTAGETYTIPVKAGAASVGTNCMVASVAGGTVSAGEGSVVNYVLMNVGGNPVFQWIGSTSATLGANKAYLALTGGPKDPGARGLWFDDDMTTGIDKVQDSSFKVQGAEVYNLNGQRVLNPTKGLYIVNGRKVVVK